MNIPHAKQFEEEVLGCIMRNGVTAMHDCVALRKEHFYFAHYGELFESCRSILEIQDDISPIMVWEHRGKKDDLAQLLAFEEGLYLGMKLDVRAEVLIEKWRQRRGLRICDEYRSRFEADDNSAKAVELLSGLQSACFSIIEDSASDDEPLVSAYSSRAMAQWIEDAEQESENTLTYGVEQLDQWTGGLKPGQVTVVGARSGVGKSSLMKQAAAANAGRGVPVTLFSLEMSREELLRGLWAMVSNIPFWKVNNPRACTAMERQRVAAACRTVSSWPLRIYERADMNIEQICAHAQMNIRRYGTKLVCVDYAQSVEAEGKDERLRVANVSRKLTKMAKSEGCSLLLLSQLRKVPQEQYAKPPTAADLRETGQLENDAHVIILLHRGWDEERCCIPQEASLLIPKMRNGRTGAVPAYFNSNNLCFEPQSTR